MFCGKPSRILKPGRKGNDLRHHAGGRAAAEAENKRGAFCRMRVRGNPQKSMPAEDEERKPPGHHRAAGKASEQMFGPEDKASFLAQAPEFTAEEFRRVVSVQLTARKA